MIMQNKPTLKNNKIQRILRILPLLKNQKSLTLADKIKILIKIILTKKLIPN